MSASTNANSQDFSEHEKHQLLSLLSKTSHLNLYTKANLSVANKNSYSLNKDEINNHFSKLLSIFENAFTAINQSIQESKIRVKYTCYILIPWQILTELKGILRYYYDVYTLDTTYDSPLLDGVERHTSK